MICLLLKLTRILLLTHLTCNIILELRDRRIKDLLCLLPVPYYRQVVILFHCPIGI